MEKPVLVFHGKSAAGKTSLMRRLTEEKKFVALDILQFVEPNILRVGSNNKPSDMFLQLLYNDLVNEFIAGDYDTVETGTDTPTYVIPKLYDDIHIKGRKPVLIFCNLSLETARKRNNERSSPVPEWILVRQNEQEISGAYKEVADKFMCPVITLDCEQSFEEVYSILEQEIYPYY